MQNIGCLLLLASGMFALGLDAYVMAGLMPAMGATFHTDPSRTGQAVSVFTLCYALAAPLFATMLAGKPVRKMFLIALGIFTVANAATALAASLTWMLVARAIAGVGAGLYSPLAVAAAASLVSAEKRGQALGMTLGGMSMGTVIGVPVGLMIADHIGWQWTLWLVTAMGFASLLGILFWFPNIPAGSPPTLRQRVAVLTDRKVAATVGITFLVSVASLGLYTYMSPVLAGAASIHFIGPYMWAWSIGGVIGSFSIGALIDWTGRPSYLMLGIITLLAVVLFSLPFGLRFPLLGYLPFLIWGAMGWASQAPQQHALITFQPKHGAAAVALNSSANYLGGAVGSALGGLVLLAGLSPAMLPFAAGAVALVALTGQLIQCARVR